MVKRIRLRTLLIGGVITLLFVLLVGRVYLVQVVEADFWLGKARETWATSEKLTAVRGTLLDRDGNRLAMDAPAYTVAVGPGVIQKLGIGDQVVNGLHELLGKSVAGLQEDVSKKRDNGEYLVQREVRSEGWKIDKELADKVADLRDELRASTGQRDVGIYLISEQKRYYPKNSRAAHLLGYVKKDGEAVYGLEAYYDDLLRGEDGYIHYEKDGKRVQLANGEVDYKPAVDGNNITLTLNSEIQYYLEEAIRQASEQYNPKSITAIAADPKTMEILGLANYPTFDPNKYWEYPQENFFNHAIGSLYEPGSTFKIVTLAGAVEEGVFNPNATYMSGGIQVEDYYLRDHQRGGWGEISYLDGLKYSSNVAFVKLGYEQLGANRLRQYITDFGFGQRTGIALRGELPGAITFRWPSEIATAAYGQGRVQVTAIQQVAAVAAVANGGKLLAPTMVKKIEDPVKKTTQLVQPKVIRQVISEETAAKVSEYLEQVVSDREKGTGRNAYIEGYRVAGKTGTAQKVVAGGNTYAENKYVVSFIGFAPVEDPRLVIYVVVDEPDDPYASGSSVAAPIFKKVMEQSLRHLGVMPSTPAGDWESQERPVATVPDVVSKKVSEAHGVLNKEGLPFEVIGKGVTVLQQIPEPGTIIPQAQRVYLITEERKQLAIPDMIGLPLRDALEVCSMLDVRCMTEGEGFVFYQEESKLNGEAVLQLRLSPPGQLLSGEARAAAEALAHEELAAEEAEASDDGQEAGAADQEQEAGATDEGQEVAAVR